MGVLTELGGNRIPRSTSADRLTPLDYVPGIKLIEGEISIEVSVSEIFEVRYMPRSFLGEELEVKLTLVRNDLGTTELPKLSFGGKGKRGVGGISRQYNEPPKQ